MKISIEPKQINPLVTVDTFEWLGIAPNGYNPTTGILRAQCRVAAGTIPIGVSVISLNTNDPETPWTSDEQLCRLLAVKAGFTPA